MACFLEKIISINLNFLVLNFLALWYFENQLVVGGPDSGLWAHIRDKSGRISRRWFRHLTMMWGHEESFQGWWPTSPSPLHQLGIPHPIASVLQAYLIIHNPLSKCPFLLQALATRITKFSNCINYAKKENNFQESFTFFRRSTFHFFFLKIKPWQSG